MYRPARGFTLIELILVVAIIGILSSILFVAFSTARAKAHDTARKTTIRQTMNALELYAIDHNDYPLMAVPTDVISTLGPLLVPNYITSTSYDITNTSGSTYYRPIVPGHSYLIYVALENQVAPTIFGCRMGVGPAADPATGLYPGVPFC